jgi:hypothetical protein
MFTHREDGLAGVWRWRVGLLAAVAAALSAAAMVDASGASALTFVHSAKSGELKGGRLILYGVGGRVSYTTRSGRTGTAALRHLHKGVFLPGRPATGVLHVAGHRGGDEPSFRLSNPRYQAARRTLSFTAKRLDRKRLPGRANATGTAQTPLRTTASSTAAQQGHWYWPTSTSLTVTPNASVAPSPQGGNTCEVDMDIKQPAYGWTTMHVSSYSKWDTDSWITIPPNGWAPTDNGNGQRISYASQGSLARGCSNTAVFEWDNLSGTFTIITTWNWGSSAPISTCNGDQNGTTMFGNGDWKCTRNDHDGRITWTIGHT